ncbi:MAG TPA: ATP cone domain-containing protein, partial [Candidatus Paceibacterota bacterium]
MAMFITKADGEREPYNSHKLLQSLKRAGAEAAIAESIEKDIEKELYNGISTQEMYRRAFAHLREHRKETAARYSLKRALLEFGPSGFPFEEYLARLFQAEGYETKTDQIIK